MIVDVRNLKDRTQKIADNALLSVPILLDDQEISGEKYGVFATPTTFIVDQYGRAIFKHIGYVEGHEKMLEREIELLLARETT